MPSFYADEAYCVYIQRCFPVIHLKITIYVCFLLITVAVIHHMMGMYNVVKHI